MTTHTIPGTDPSQPYVLERGDGDHHHFLNHLATRKVTAGQSGSMTAVEFLAPKGFGPPLHRHDAEDEIMIVLDGTIVFRSGDDETIAGDGATVFLPHGVPHTFQVLSETARFTTITSAANERPEFDQFVAELGTPTVGPVLPEPTDVDPGRVAQVCRQYGMDVMGPPPAPLAD